MGLPFGCHCRRRPRTAPSGYGAAARRGLFFGWRMPSLCYPGRPSPSCIRRAHSPRVGRFPGGWSGGARVPYSPLAQRPGSPGGSSTGAPGGDMVPPDATLARGSPPLCPVLGRRGPSSHAPACRGPGQSLCPHGRAAGACPSPCRSALVPPTPSPQPGRRGGPAQPFDTASLGGGCTRGGDPPGGGPHARGATRMGGGRVSPSAGCPPPHPFLRE